MNSANVDEAVIPAHRAITIAATPIPINRPVGASGSHSGESAKYAPSTTLNTSHAAKGRRCPTVASRTIGVRIAFPECFLSTGAEAVLLTVKVVFVFLGVRVVSFAIAVASKRSRVCLLRTISGQHRYFYRIDALRVTIQGMAK